MLKGSAILDMGLGGTTAASGDVIGDGTADIITSTGSGTYSTFETDTLVIDGELRLSLYYGFPPRPGNTFQIVTVNGIQRRNHRYSGGRLRGLNRSQPLLAPELPGRRP